MWSYYLKHKKSGFCWIFSISNRWHFVPWLEAMATMEWKVDQQERSVWNYFWSPKNLNSSNQRIPCLMEHYSKGRNEEEELNSANIPLMGLPKGHGWMLITGGTRFYSWIYWQIMNWCKTLKEWSGHLNIVLFQVTDCPWSCLYPYQRRRHSRFATWLLIPFP